MSVIEPSFAIKRRLTDRGTSTCASRKSPPPVRTLVGWLVGWLENSYSGFEGSNIGDLSLQPGWGLV